jgi:hypothetical protein
MKIWYQFYFKLLINEVGNESRFYIRCTADFVRNRHRIEIKNKKGFGGQ